MVGREVRGRGEDEGADAALSPRCVEAKMAGKTPHKAIGIMSSDEISKMMILGDQEAERLRQAEREFLQAEKEKERQLEREREKREKEQADLASSHTQQSGADEMPLSPSLGPGRSAGLGPNGAWEHVQVLTEEMANMLVLNRGAVFMKYSFKKGSVGVRSKAERLVWLSGDNKIMWKDVSSTPTSTSSVSASLSSWGTTAPKMTLKHEMSSSSGEHGRGSGDTCIAVSDVKSISTTPPAHYGSADDRSIYIVSKKRSLLLEARDAQDRDFWYEQLSVLVAVAQTKQREVKRQDKLKQVVCLINIYVYM